MPRKALVSNGLEPILRTFTAAEETQADIDEANAKAEAVAAVVPAIKAEAARRIEAIMPPWQIDRDATTADQTKKIPQATKTATDAIRDASDAFEIEVAAMTDDQKLAVDVADDSHWPA